MAALLFPLLQLVPLPGDVISFQRDGVEICAYRYGEGSPYLFPLVGPSGRYVTRYGHPVDPEGHKHHRSVWIAHADVAGSDLWSIRGRCGTMQHLRIVRFTQEERSAGLVTELEWRDPDGKPLVGEEREVRVTALPDGEFLLDIVMKLTAKADGVALNKTNYGPIGVRVAETMSVRNGGEVLNSEGDRNEAGALWKQARWCDYSGPVTADRWNGIALLDHPQNPSHPPAWIMRDEGWMGPCPCRDEGVSLPTTFRYRLYVHDGKADPERIQGQWEAFAG